MALGWDLVNTFVVTSCSHALMTLSWAGIVPLPARGMVSEGVGIALAVLALAAEERQKGLMGDRLLLLL